MIWGLLLIISLAIVVVSVYRVGFNDGFTAGQISRYMDENRGSHNEMRDMPPRD
jgi:hypothetical protein